MKITEKNIDMINGRLKKFFSLGSHFYEWHTFSSKKCMSKGKVSTKEDDFLNSIKRESEKRDFLKFKVKEYIFNKEEKTIIIETLDEFYDESFYFLEIGNEIIFKGNRIIIKEYFPIFKNEGKFYTYTCLQKF